MRDGVAKFLLAASAQKNPVGQLKCFADMGLQAEQSAMQILHAANGQHVNCAKSYHWQHVFTDMHLDLAQRYNPWRAQAAPAHSWHFSPFRRFSGMRSRDTQVMRLRPVVLSKNLFICSSNAASLIAGASPGQAET
jgi:hypothetical protein